MMLRRRLGLVIAVPLGAYFIWHCVRVLPQLDLSILARPRSLLGFMAATLIYMLGVPLAGMAWFQLTRGSAGLTPGELSLIIARSQAAKYVPGNVAQYALRFGMAVQRGMQARTYLVSTGQETLLVVAASVTVGTLAMAMAARATPELPDWVRMLAVSLPLLVCLVLGMSGLRGHSPLLERFLQIRIGNASLRLGDLLPPAGRGLVAFALYSANYLLVGFAFWLLARSLHLPQSMGLLLITSAFALSWLLGFLAPGAPAGIGVRESSMVWLMSHSAAAPEILVLVLMTRLATLTGDGLSFLIGWIAHLREQPEP